MGLAGLVVGIGSKTPIEYGFRFAADTARGWRFYEYFASGCVALIGTIPMIKFRTNKQTNKHQIRGAVCLFVCLLEEEMSVISLGQADLEKK